MKRYTTSCMCKEKNTNSYMDVDRSLFEERTHLVVVQSIKPTLLPAFLLSFRFVLSIVLSTEIEVRTSKMAFLLLLHAAQRETGINHNADTSFWNDDSGKCYESTLAPSSKFSDSTCVLYSVHWPESLSWVSPFTKTTLWFLVKESFAVERWRHTSSTFTLSQNCFGSSVSLSNF